MFDAHRKTDVGLVTFNDGVDTVLGDDGLMPGKVTEIYGQAGGGKTQLCLQLCANVQLPTVIGGLGGKALYLDTEGGFTGRRMQQIAVKTCRTGFIFGRFFRWLLGLCSTPQNVRRSQIFMATRRFFQCWRECQFNEFLMVCFLGKRSFDFLGLLRG